MLVIVLGNALVVAAITRDRRRLGGVQNYFVASLAGSDLLVGLFIMPLSLANELMGYWAFGDVLCELWLATDVLLCTASILNLAVISLDRYWSITRAVTYAKQRTLGRVLLMIAGVWTLSVVVSLPPLVGWKRPQPVLAGYPLCLLSEEPGYVIYSTIGSFYVPLVVIVVVYSKIYVAARSRARRTLAAAAPRRSRRSRRNITQQNVPRSTTGSTLCSQPRIEPSADELAVLQRVPDDRTPRLTPTTLSVEVPTSLSIRKASISLSVEPDDVTDFDLAQHEGPASDFPDSGSEDDASTPQAIFTTPDVQTAEFSVEAAYSLPDNGIPEASVSTGGPRATVSSTAVTASEMDKVRRRLARSRERRATLVLGIVMASFIGCWMPFFSIYPLSLLFDFDVPTSVFAVIFWLGYCNSALNPIIYTIFNREFRAAFSRMLCPRCPQTPAPGPSRF